MRQFVPMPRCRSLKSKPVEIIEHVFLFAKRKRYNHWGYGTTPCESQRWILHSRIQLKMSQFWSCFSLRCEELRVRNRWRREKWCERASKLVQMRAICQRPTGKRCENGRGLTCGRFAFLLSSLRLPLCLVA